MRGFFLLLPSRRDETRGGEEAFSNISGHWAKSEGVEGSGNWKDVLLTPPSLSSR